MGHVGEDVAVLLEKDERVSDTLWLSMMTEYHTHCCTGTVTFYFRYLISQYRQLMFFKAHTPKTALYSHCFLQKLHVITSKFLYQFLTNITKLYRQLYHLFYRCFSLFPNLKIDQVQQFTDAD